LYDSDLNTEAGALQNEPFLQMASILSTISKDAITLVTPLKAIADMKKLEVSEEICSSILKLFLLFVV